MRLNNILLTGASGFVGRHMAAVLVGRGHKVSGLARGSAAGFPKGVEWLPADLSDASSLEQVPREWNAVVHLAGASIPSLYATAAPVASNVQLTLNLLEHLKAGRVLLVSSCHVYSPASQPRREEDPTIPNGRYGLSKHLLEELAPHYRRQLDIRVARPFNHLGPGQRPELVIPSLLRRLAATPHETAPVVMKGLNSTRDFIDVRDVCEAYLAILELESPNQTTFNVCTGRGHTIEQVVKEVLHQLGSRRAVVFEGRPNSTDDNQVLVGDPSRLAQAGWRARFSLAESLASMLQSTELEKS